ncbi:carboxypeptidase-like regulatory domain-containing protein [Aeromicrobium wangtongii]|uniref:carboxypeptidase-like regulatory domain-containing protein n=1 Tax=Aeromicrobium wangtongii TaxID=2969247 RepID=UPI002017427C|nr:carboxypeptidase regulatory-like domain-containing protein [Aeromicrobium wangtongii]MCL3818342.1 carboxypeptidase-like regulatory domain-containing protein [Aeromicrobium wangtongii]
MSSRLSSRTAPAVALASLGLLLGGLAAPAGAATGTGKLSGTVTLDGGGIGFAKVQLYRNVIKGQESTKPVRVKTDNTDGRGRYSFTGIPVKSSYNYTLLVTDRTGRTVKTFRHVDPVAGKKVTKNVRMKVAALLTGTVMRADGGSPADLTVGVDIDTVDRGDAGPDFDMFFPEQRAAVKADGSFTLSGLPSGPAGTYANVKVSGGPYAEQCYDFVAVRLADCAPQDPASLQRQQITLAKGEARTLPNVTVTKLAPPVSRLTGTVTDTSGTPLKGMQVTVRALPSGEAEAGEPVLTRSSGGFTFPKVPAGTYVVRVDDPDGVWAKQYLGGGLNQWASQRVVVADGRPVRNVDVQLKSTATVKVGRKAGKGSAKVAVLITRTLTGSKPGGRVVLSHEGRTKEATVVNGRATLTLKSLPKGTQKLRLTYSGTSSTAGFTKTVTVKVQ